MGGSSEPAPGLNAMPTLDTADGGGTCVLEPDRLSACMVPSRVLGDFDCAPVLLANDLAA